MNAKARPHGFVTKTFHWLTGGLLVYGYANGVENVGQLADPTVFQTEIIFAAALGLAFAARLAWTRLTGGESRLPAEAPAWERKAARVVHFGLYAGVFGIVLSGLAIAWAYATPALSGLALTLFLGLHEAALIATVLLLIVHIAGALWHKFVRRDGVLESMTGKLPV